MMKKTARLLVMLVLAPVGMASFAAAAERELFNGKDLSGWEGKAGLWSVEDGAITGRTTKDQPLKSNTFLVWQGGKVGDFELTLQYRIVGGNSGIQYRSKIVQQTPETGPVVAGYQADFEAGKTYSGILYEEKGRGILAQRGQKTVVKADPQDPKKTKVEVVGSTGDAKLIQDAIKAEDWNEYRIVARGNRLHHFINGKPTVEVVDEQPEKAAKEGILALQLHVGPPMVVQFKNIKLKTDD